MMCMYDSVAVDNVMACGYSACGTGFDVLRRDYHCLQSQLEAFLIKIEVASVLECAIQRVCELHAAEGLSKY